MSDKIKAVLALGYFDGVHKGHVSVIERAKDSAEKNGNKLVVVSFGGNLRAALGKGTETFIYKEEERRELFFALGADEVVFFPATKEFLSMTGEEFLNRLNGKYDVKEYVCGEACDVRFLEDYASFKGQTLTTVKTMFIGGEKISSSLIKDLLRKGELEKANALLYVPYFMAGKVVKGRGEGHVLGFPTVNIIPDVKKAELKRGVYFGETVIDGKTYKAMINYGNSPTFSNGEDVIEAYALGFSGNAYGKTVKIVFRKYARDAVKFSGEKELIKRLTEDEKILKETIYD